MTMSDKKTYDTNDPVLIVVRKGRNGKGYIVAPADSDHLCPCMSEEDLGFAISEIINDENQPRLSEGGRRSAVASAVDPEKINGKKVKKNKSDPEPEEDEEGDGDDDSMHDGMGITDRILINALGNIIGRAQSASTWRRSK